jgi:hypothetical protein
MEEHDRSPLPGKCRAASVAPSVLMRTVSTPATDTLLQQLVGFRPGVRRVDAGADGRVRVEQDLHEP